jgi:hypothetical protein
MDMDWASGIAAVALAALLVSMIVWFFAPPKRQEPPTPRLGAWEPEPRQSRRKIGIGLYRAGF